VIRGLGFLPLYVFVVAVNKLAVKTHLIL
jgi:hypothetical protein